LKKKFIILTAWKNIFRNKRRSLLSISAIAVAVSLVCFMKSYVDGLMENMAKNIFLFQTGHVKISHKDYEKEKKLMPLDLNISGFESDYTEIVNTVSKMSGVYEVLPRIHFASFIDRKDKLKNVLVLALDLQHEKSLNLKKKIIEGRIFEEWTPEKSNRPEIIICKTLAAELGVKCGDKVTMLTRSAEEGLAHMTFYVSGIVSTEVINIDKYYIFMPLITAQYFLKMENAVLEILVLCKTKNIANKIAFMINNFMNLNKDNPYIAESWTVQNDGQYYKILTMGTKIYSLVYLVFLLLASLVIVNTTMMTVFERTKEIGTISAMGMRGKDIILLFFLEAVFLSVIASFIGTFIGGAFSFFFSRAGIDFATLSGGGMDFQISERIFTTFNSSLLVFSFLFGIIVSALCSFFPAKYAAKIEPVIAIRGRM